MVILVLSSLPLQLPGLFSLIILLIKMLVVKFLGIFASCSQYNPSPGILTRLKDQNKKLTTLANNRKLGEREKLELELTTARVTIAHQENKIQVRTVSVELTLLIC